MRCLRLTNVKHGKLLAPNKPFNLFMLCLNITVNLINIRIKSKNIMLGIP